MLSYIYPRTHGYIVGNLGEDELGRLHVFTAEEAIAYLDEQAASAQATETLSMVIRVKGTYRAVSAKERDARRQEIGQVLRRSLKHVKDNG